MIRQLVVSTFRIKFQLDEKLEFRNVRACGYAEIAKIGNQDCPFYTVSDEYCISAVEEISPTILHLNTTNLHSSASDIVCAIESSVLLTMTRDYRPSDGHIVKRNRRRYLLVDGATLQMARDDRRVVECDELRQSRLILSAANNREGPTRGEFPLPTWFTRNQSAGEAQETSAVLLHERRQPPRRMELLNDKITSTNTKVASTISLLRARARDIAHRHNQLLRIMRNERVEEFVWITPEGHGGERERSDVLLHYIDTAVIDVTEIERDIHLDRGASRRLRSAK